MSNMPSAAFIAAVRAALDRAKAHNDRAVVYMADAIPVFAQLDATPEQKKAGGNPNGLFFGLWAREWPGYPYSQHGLVWLFERGIRSLGGDLVNNAFTVLLHEFDHALQRDHVLEALERKQAMDKAQGCGC
ncbi:MAG: hypothetical protein C4542_09640 [Dehalococcoidia bacterium]|nr:MAG: hypothetical protein C4542_09640 [Dehalococcoidia bacterium]